MRDLPPLKAVRAFEACYRLGSFTKAAGELNVKQPAISHQIRALEKDLGTRLFRKQANNVVPTSEANELYPTVSTALDELARASARLRDRRNTGPITLATYPGIASYWVLPRLARLRANRPDLSVRIVTSELDAEISPHDVDCAILFGDGSWPGVRAELLFHESVVPVCAPALRARLGDLTPAELLRNGPLIHLEDPENRWFTWDDWQARFAPDADAVDHSALLTNHGIAIHQAIQGLGVALGWTEVIADLLRSGVLVTVFDQPLTSERGYYLVSHGGFRDGERYARIVEAFAVDDARRID